MVLFIWFEKIVRCFCGYRFRASILWHWFFFSRTIERREFRNAIRIFWKNVIDMTHIIYWYFNRDFEHLIISINVIYKLLKWRDSNKAVYFLSDIYDEKRLKKVEVNLMMILFLLLHKMSGVDVIFVGFSHKIIWS